LLDGCGEALSGVGGFGGGLRYGVLDMSRALVLGVFGNRGCRMISETV
jgi:hypothetical protein